MDSAPVPEVACTFMELVNEAKLQKQTIHGIYVMSVVLYSVLLASNILIVLTKVWKLQEPKFHYLMHTLLILASITYIVAVYESKQSIYDLSNLTLKNLVSNRTPLN